jgi:hypothetical protein
MDAEGARALARRIAEQENGEQAEAASAADGQTLEQRLTVARTPPSASPAAPEDRVAPGAELRVYARAVEEHVAGDVCTYVEVWWCRVRERGIWQPPHVVREAIRETVPIPSPSRRRRPAVRMLAPWGRGRS